MARRNLSLGTAAGRIGDHVYFRRRGQQIIRVRVPAPLDPRSVRQGVVRARFANSTNLWRVLRPIVGNSWSAARRYGSQGNAWARHNRGQMPTISAAEAKFGSCYPALGLVTYGSLVTSLTYRFASEGSLEDETYRSGVALGYRLPALEGFTVGDLSRSIIAADGFLRDGDELHFCVLTYEMEIPQPSPISTPTLVPSFRENVLVLDSASTEPFTPVLSLFGLSFVTGDDGFDTMTLLTSIADIDPDVDSARVWQAFCVFAVRPTNPQYSRYSRSSLVMSREQRLAITPLLTYGVNSIAFGNTFIN